MKQYEFMGEILPSFAVVIGPIRCSCSPSLPFGLDLTHARPKVSLIVLAQIFCNIFMTQHQKIYAIDSQCSMILFSKFAIFFQHTRWFLAKTKKDAGYSAEFSFKLHFNTTLAAA